MKFETDMPLQQLLKTIQDISQGHYSDDIMALTGSETPEPIRTIAEAMGMMMVKVEAREYQLELMIKELEELNETVKNNTIATVSAMASALAARDTYTVGHVERVAEYCCQIAKAMELSEQDIEYIRLGGLLHDMGKIGFPDALFVPHEKNNKSEIIKKIVKHPATGAEILAKLDFLGPAVEYVHCHHEKLDGTGYPRHLSGDDIPLGARIIAVADTFDAITTDRPYQKGRSEQEALQILQQEAGVALDADVVHFFTKVLKEEERKIEGLYDKKSSYELLEDIDIFKIINLQKGSTVADLACGRGTYSKVLARHIGEKGTVFAVDLWQNGLAFLDRQLLNKDITNENIITLRADVGRHIPIEDKQVDFCLMTTHLHYLQENGLVSRAIRECARILRKKGTLVIIEFNPDSIRLAEFQGTGSQVMSPEQIITAIAPHGFTWVQTEPLGQDLQLCLFRKGKGA